MTTISGRPMLVVVHPGSACGSADFHLGSRQAMHSRSQIADVLSRWVGDVVVIDSDLSDEIDGHPVLAYALDGCLARSATDGHAERLLAMTDRNEYDMFGWLLQAERRVIGLAPSHVTITGAWFHEDDEHGCVNAMLRVVEDAGIPVVVHESALRL